MACPRAVLANRDAREMTGGRRKQYTYEKRHRKYEQRGTREPTRRSIKENIALPTRSCSDFREEQSNPNLPQILLSEATIITLSLPVIYGEEVCNAERLRSIFHE